MENHRSRDQARHVMTLLNLPTIHEIYDPALGKHFYKIIDTFILSNTSSLRGHAMTLFWIIWAYYLKQYN